MELSYHFNTHLFILIEWNPNLNKTSNILILIHGPYK
jgi:hypothetical protein